MISREDAISDFIDWYAETSTAEENLAKDIGNIYDSIGRCETCLYSEKTTDTRWKCEYLDDIRVRPNFFCADYIKESK